MQLKYHQKTYDLLTQEYIDPQPAIDNFEQYAVPHAFMLRKSYMDDAAIHKMVEQQRESELAWTKLQLYQRPAQFSDENVLKLDELEKKYNAKLPLSVREWLSLDIVPEIMSVNADGYLAAYLSLEEIAPFTTKYFRMGEARDDLWYLLHGEYIDQGGESVLFQVGGNDDPPVFAEYGDEYIELAPTFSQFIYRQFWLWHLKYVFRYAVEIHALDLFRPPKQFWIPLQRLQEHFVQLPDARHLYFYDDNIRILARHPLSTKTMARFPVVEDDSVIAGGSFHARDFHNLTKLMQQLWDDNAPVFYMESYNERVQKLIKDLQCEQVKSVLTGQQSWITAKAIADRLNLKTAGYMRDALKHLVERNEIEKRVEIDSENKTTDSYRIVEQNNKGEGES